MYATALQIPRFSAREKFLMAIIGDKFKPEISLGSILVGLGMLVSVVIYVANDHAETAQMALQNGELRAQNSLIIAKVDALSVQLPVEAKTIEIDSSRISQIEVQERNMLDKIGQLQELEAITEETVNQLKQSYSDLVTSSQGAAPVHRPRVH